MEKYSDDFGDVNFDVEAKLKQSTKLKHPTNKFSLNQDS